MTAIASYLVVQDCEGSPSTYWEANYSFSTGNNLNFKIYGGATEVPIPLDLEYLDVRDCQGTPDNIWYVGTQSVDSGNNSQIYFTTSPVVDVQIYGFASMVGAGQRLRTANGSVLGEAGVFANGGGTYPVSVAITGNGTVSANGGKTSTSSASITGSGTATANGKIMGEEWSDVATESEVWREI